MRLLTLLLIVAALATPLASAHASPDPLEVETHVLADDTSDAYNEYDGFDIQDLYVREVHFRTGEPAVVARVYLYGGFAANPLASSMNIEVDITTSAGTTTKSASSTDGTNWDGPAVVEQVFEPTDGATGTQGYLQFIFELEELGVTVGDSIGPFAVRTYADADLRDVAPGGIPAPGSGGNVVVPVEGGFVVDSYPLQGPIGYTRSTLRAEGALVTINAQNLITVTGQHLTLNAPNLNGWAVDWDDPPSAAVEPGIHPVFSFNVTAVGDGPLQLVLTSDLGGREALVLAPDAVVLPTGSKPDTPDIDPDAAQPTPLPLAAGIMAALGTASLLRRRQ